MSELDPKGESPLRKPVPGERIRTVCLVLIALCVVGAALFHLRSILTPLFVALFLFFLIKPLADTFARSRLPAWFSYTLLCVLLVVAVYAIGLVVEGNVEAFQTRLPEYRSRLLKLADTVARLLGRVDPEGHVESGWQTLGQLFDVTWQEIASYAFGTALGFIETAVMVLFYLLFLFLEAEQLPRRVRATYPREKADKFLRIGQNIRDGINSYLAIKTAVSIGLGMTTGILGYLFGLDFWPLWAVLMFLGNYVTYVGSMVALVPPAGLAYLQFSSPVAASVFAVLIVLNRFIWIDFCEIRLSGKQLNISPLLLLLSLAVFGWMWGVVGMVLAVPLVTVTRIILLNFETTKHWGMLISEK